MGDPISLLIGLVVVALVGYLFWWALSQIPLPAPARTVVIVLLVLILIWWIVQRFGGLAGI